MDFALRLEVEDLYAKYAACINQENFEAWPDLFVDDCRYVVQPRENFEREMPLATISLDSKGMLKDRIYGITTTLFFAPHYQRHLITGILATEDGDAIKAEANYLVIRTKRNDLSDILSCGRYIDRIVRTSDGLKFKEKICVFDSETIPNSLVYPV